MFKNSISKYIKKSILFLGSTLPLMLVTRLALADEPVDYLKQAGGLTSFMKNFGKNSDVYWIIMGAGIVYTLYEFFHHEKKIGALTKPLIGIVAFNLLWMLLPS